MGLYLHGVRYHNTDKKLIMFDNKVGGKKRKRGHYRLNEVEHEFMRLLIANGVASLTVDDEKKAQYVRTRIRDVLRKQGCKDLVSMAVRGKVVVAWMLAEYDTCRLNDTIWSNALNKGNSLVCGYGRRARRDGSADKRVLELGMFGASGEESIEDAINKFKRRHDFHDDTTTKTELSFKTKPTDAQPMDSSSTLDAERLRHIWKENLDAGIWTQEQYDEKIKELKNE